MGEISAELKKFKESVETNIGALKSNCEKLTTSFDTLSTATTSFTSSLNNYYKSQNNSTILASFDSVGEGFKKISSTFSDQLSSILSACEGLVKMIENLEKINEDIKKTTTELNNATTDEEKDQYQTDITNLENKFKDEHEKAKAELERIIGMDGSVDPGISESTGAATQDYGAIVGTSYSLYHDNASGLDYYIYIPKYAKNVDKLPLLVHLGGDGEVGGNTNGNSLGYLLNSKQAQPNAIVVVPVIPPSQGGYSGRTFSMPSFQDAVATLTKSVMSKYPVDTNKVSLSGYSNGAIAGYKVIERNPNIFKKFVPISGSNDVDPSRFGNVKIWSFFGSNERSEGNTDLSKAQRRLQQLLNSGCQVDLELIPGEHHATSKEPWKNKYSKDGKTTTILDWICS